MKLIWRSGIQVEERHTRLCRWMVYSRATTSAMADRVVVGFFVVLGVVLGVGILTVKGDSTLVDSWAHDSWKA